MAEFFKPKKQALKTPEQAYAELLGDSSENQVVEIRCDLIDEIDDQPQTIHQDKIDRIAESMLYVGQIDPVTVVPSKKEGRYTLLAGRHRRRACIKNGLPTVKAIIRKESNPDKQRLILLATNNDRDTDYLPSEIAFSFSEQAQLLKKLGSKSTSTVIADQNNTDRKAVHRYIRLTYLIKPLLNRIDGGSITVVAGYELSFLTEQQQISVLNFILNHPDKSKIDKDIAREIRLEPDNLQSIFYPPVDVPAAVDDEDALETDDAEPKAEKKIIEDKRTEEKENKNNNASVKETKGTIESLADIDTETQLIIVKEFIKITKVDKKIIKEFFGTNEILNYIKENYINCHYSIYNSTCSCDFKSKFCVRIFNNKNDYVLSYRELDELARQYIRSHYTTEEIINIIKNT